MYALAVARIPRVGLLANLEAGGDKELGQSVARQRWHGGRIAGMTRLQILDRGVAIGPVFAVRSLSLPFLFYVDSLFETLKLVTALRSRLPYA